MLVHVFDTYITTTLGKRMHFDVLVPNENADKVHHYVKEWLDSIGVEAAAIKQKTCNYCHSEVADEAIHHDIQKQGYYILQMAGCPEPV